MWKLDYSIPLLILMEQSTNLGIPASRRRTCWLLKEQYPVSAHAPNFDFWTGCREIKRCEESKRTLKNPFASRLAGSNTTLKHLRITDQWYFVPVKFLFGQKLDFLAFFYCRWPEDLKIGSTLMPIEGLFLLLASIQAQIIVRGIQKRGKNRWRSRVRIIGTLSL